MLRSLSHKPPYGFSLLFLIASILFVTSCSEPATPTIEQRSSGTPPQQLTDRPTSATKISPGQHLRFDTISLEEGLSQSTVFCMLQDSQGFMWFGTEGGLNRYDGYSFTTYIHDSEDLNGWSDDYIQALIEDHSGMLWFGTREGGLVRYDRTLDQFTNYRNDPNDPSSLSANEITAIYQDQDDVLWIGTDGGGLERFDQESERFIHYHHNPDDPNSLSSNAVFAIFQDQGGALWIGTDGGLNKLEPENDRWSHYLNDPNDPNSIQHSKITAISEDQSGSLWIGTDSGGLDRFDPENQQVVHYQHDPDDTQSLGSDEIMAIYLDREGNLWIGTYGEGINRYDREKDAFTHYQNIPGDPNSLSSDIVMSIFQDREGVLWFGTIGGGVNKLDIGLMNFAIYQNEPDNPNSLGDNMVRAFYEENNGALWIGSMFGGVDRFDRETGNWRHFRHDPDDPGSLSNDFVSTIYKDRSGELWIGTASGLDRLDPETGSFTHYQADPNGPSGSPDNNVRTIYESETGKLWIGTKGGLYQFDTDKGSWGEHFSHNPGKPDSLSNDWIFKFMEDRQGRFWIGTLGGGLNRFDSEKERFTRYQYDPGNQHSVSSDIVVEIFQDQEGALWLATSGGLDRFDPGTETFTHYREKEGMPNDNIYCILEDGEGYLWASTNKGLSRFDPQSKTFRNYDVTDGLQSNEFNACACLKSDSGEMFFGGIDGFNTFFPDQIMDNPTTPPVVLTSLTQDGEDVNLGMAVDRLTEVTFKSPDNSFEFEFAALSYANSEKNQYAYILEDFDDDWNKIGARRYGKYTNLPGGTYTLRLRGSNNDGVWNEAGVAVQITIVPPFWSTWWFRGIILLTLVGIIYGGFRLRVRNLEVRERELESQVDQRTAELMKTQDALRQSELEKAITEERSRLARNLHDSVTQSIFSVTLTAEAAKILIDRDKEQTVVQLDRLLELSGSALAEMRSLIFELRPTAVAELGILPALNQYIARLDEFNNLKVDLHVQGEPNLEDLEAQRLFFVIREALNNIIKHADVDEAGVALDFGNDRVLLKVEDHGKGFDPSSIDPTTNKMGLSSMRERVEKFGGTLALDSQIGMGTKLTVEIPVTKEITDDN